MKGCGSQKYQYVFVWMVSLRTGNNIYIYNYISPFSKSHFFQDYCMCYMCSFVAPERSSCHSWAVVVAPGYAGYAGWVDWTHQSFRILGATEGMSHKTFLQDPWGGIRWLQLKYAKFPWCQLCLSRFSIPFRASVLRFTQFWEVKRLNINESSMVILSEWTVAKK